MPLREIQLLEHPRLRQLHRDYLQCLFNEFEHVDLSYLLDARPEKPISLLDVYVQTYRWGRIESEIAPALMKYLMITGDPGSGKSTLLRHS